jgi:hypothetical protein
MAGVHLKVVEERLGHSTIAGTLDMYSHVTAGMQADAAATVADLMRSSVTNPAPTHESQAPDPHFRGADGGTRTSTRPVMARCGAFMKPLDPGDIRPMSTIAPHLS